MMGYFTTVVYFVKRKQVYNNKWSKYPRPHIKNTFFNVGVVKHIQ